MAVDPRRLSRHAQPGASVGMVRPSADCQCRNPVGQEFAARLASIGIETRLRLWADDSSRAVVGADALPAPVALSA